MNRSFSFFVWITLLLAALQTSHGSSIPPGCKPPELLISREHPLIILYGPGTGELTVKCWQNLPADFKPYCAVTMDPHGARCERATRGLAPEVANRAAPQYSDRVASRR